MTNVSIKQFVEIGLTHRCSLRWVIVGLLHGITHEILRFVEEVPNEVLSLPVHLVYFFVVKERLRLLQLILLLLVGFLFEERTLINFGILCCSSVFVPRLAKNFGYDCAMCQGQGTSLILKIKPDGLLLALELETEVIGAG